MKRVTPQTGSALEVLLVEDNAADVAIIERLAAGSPVPVRLSVATDGQGAVDVLCGGLGSAAPELVLLDISLPRMDGLQVLRRLRAERALQDLPVIMLSGSDDERHVHESQRLGAHTHIVKPMRHRDFLWILRSLLSYRGRIAALRRVAACEEGGHARSTESQAQ